MVKAIAEHVALLTARCDEEVRGAQVLDLALGLQPVAVFGLHFRAGRQGGQVDLKQAVEGLSHIHEPAVVAQRGDGDSGERLLHRIQLAHLGRCLDTLDMGNLGRLPAECFEALGREVGRHKACIDAFTSKLPGKPQSRVIVATLGSLPLLVGEHDRSPHAVLQHVQLGLYCRAVEGCLEGVLLVPARAYPEEQLVLALLQEGGDVIRHDERATVHLRYGGNERCVGDPFPVDIYLMVAQRIDMQEGSLPYLIYITRAREEDGFVLTDAQSDILTLHPVAALDAYGKPLGGAPSRLSAFGLYPYSPVAQLARLEGLAAIGHHHGRIVRDEA